MTVIAEFKLDSPLLRETRSAVPDATLSTVQTSMRPPRLIFWMSGADAEAFESAMSDDPSVAAFARLTEPDNSTLYRISIPEEVRKRLTYPVAVDLDIALLDAVGDADGWLLRLQFPERDAIVAYRDACAERDVGFELVRLYTTSESEDAVDGELTDPQREALALALERGYFEIPRDATTADLAAELDVSRQAVSERLRRAIRRMAQASFDFHDRQVK